jgi:hypothetical protein
MQPSELAFYTTTELVEELMRRKTFLGVVVHSAVEHRQGSCKAGKVFKVHLNANLDCEQAGRLLEAVSAQLGRLGH